MSPGTLPLRRHLARRRTLDLLFRRGRPRKAHPPRRRLRDVERRRRTKTRRARARRSLRRSLRSLRSLGRSLRSRARPHHRWSRAKPGHLSRALPRGRARGCSRAAMERRRVRIRRGGAAREARVVGVRRGRLANAGRVDSRARGRRRGGRHPSRHPGCRLVWMRTREGERLVGGAGTVDSARRRHARGVGGDRAGSRRARGKSRGGATHRLGRPGAHETIPGDENTDADGDGDGDGDGTIRIRSVPVPRDHPRDGTRAGAASVLETRRARRLGQLPIQLLDTRDDATRRANTRPRGHVSPRRGVLRPSKKHPRVPRDGSPPLVRGPRRRDAARTARVESPRVAPRLRRGGILGSRRDFRAIRVRHRRRQICVRDARG